MQTVMATVHPRACGEQTSPFSRWSETVGSSPRLRGTESDEFNRVAINGFIPAPAGNRPVVWMVIQSMTVHPRACGEQNLAGTPAARTPGSSPRLRGTDESGERRTGPDRFIPAPAGNSRLSARSCAVRSVHPRACGEQGEVMRFHVFLSGSSPRLRGTVDPHGRELGRHRFIPAPAGNRLSRRGPHASRSVHPRACGEQLTIQAVFRSSFGSSPRLRGTDNPIPFKLDSVRFIPAPAGNSSSRSLNVREESVHPRACGEQFSGARAGPGATGSSPRLRGTGHFFSPFPVPLRFIPAPAGNRTGLLHILPHGSVHPRACGEQSTPAMALSKEVGSSPRLRGTGCRSRHGSFA